VPSFTIFESNIGQDPDKRDYLVSNEKIERTGFHPAFTLDDGIRELVKGFAMIRHDARYSNA
jgi:nucleoside-diphosphate-sugar epimerase